MPAKHKFLHVSKVYGSSVNRHLKKSSRNCCVLLFNLPELGYSTATTSRKSLLLTCHEPLSTSKQTTNGLFILHRTQATISLSTSTTLPPLPVGATNIAGLDLTIGKRLIGTAGDSGVQDRLQNEERSPHTSPARGEKQQ